MSVTFEPPNGPGHPVPDMTVYGTTEGWPQDVPAWWQDDSGFEEGDGWAPFPRRRRSRVLQVTGIVVAAALVLASAGATVEVVLGGSSSTSLPAGVLSVVVLPVDTVLGSGANTPVRVKFEVVNRARSAVVPVCTVSVVGGGRVLATARVGPPELGSIAGGTRTVNNKVVAVPTAALAGSHPSGQVSCQI